MDWDDLYDDSWELYKKIGNTILPVYVGADAGFTTDTEYLDLMVRGTVVRLAHRCYIFCIKEGALRGSGAGWVGLVKHTHRWSFSQRLMMLPK